MGSRFSNFRINFVRLLSFRCLLLSAIAGSLIFSACSPRTVRTGHRYDQYAQSRNQSDNNEQPAEIKKDENPLLAELQNYENKIMAQKDAKSSETDYQPVGSLKPDTVTAHVPTLREQVKSLQQGQADVNKRMDSMEGDISEMKKTLDDIKYEIQMLNGSQPKEAVTGPVNGDYDSGAREKSQQLNKSSNIILPDEAVAKKVRPAVKKTVPKKKSYSANISKKKYSPKKVASSGNYSVDEEDTDADEKNSNEIAENHTETKPVENVSGFRAAMDAFREKKYHKAIIELSNMAKNETNPSLIGKYDYWLGEAHFGLMQYDKAISYFNRALSTGQHSKKDASVVMIAEANIRSGKIDEAKKAFNKLLDEFPTSRYVPRARKMLQQL